MILAPTELECPIVTEYKEVIKQYEILLDHITVSLERISKFVDDYISKYKLSEEES